MLINFGVAMVISRFTPPPPAEVQRMVENIRIPRTADEASNIDA
jgi:cation/acetate symporter